MEAFFVSTAVVAVAEIGDKTQLLALMLAARYRKPVPIILGILGATLANHAIAAWIGAEVAAWIGAETMRWILGVSFIVMAGWCLIPDKADDGPQTARQAGAFIATLVAFFIVEIGDKTQIATVALAARYAAFVQVVAGTTLGMMIANVPAVYLGNRLLRRVPMRPLQVLAAALFAVLGVLVLLA
jgi:Ca2+/H+ antiporter, TMEM165/GDT1 family